MSKTPEGKVKDDVKALLKSFGAYWFMPVQMGYGAAGVDFYVCHQGYFAGVETKAPGKKPTPRQQFVMREIEKAGGVTFVIDGDLSELEAWLFKISTGTI